MNFKLDLEKSRKLENKAVQVHILDDLGRLCNTTKKYQSVITYLKEGKTLARQRNLKTKDMFIACVDGLKGFPEAIE